MGKLRSFEPVNKARSLPSEERRQDFEPIEEAPPPKPKSKPAQPRIITPPKPSPSNFTEDLNGVKLEMIYIPGGEFMMGSNDHDDEKPPHLVKLSPFFIGKYQITQAQWKAVMGSNPSHWKGDDLPVERVPWNDAVKFCEAISKQTGKTYRLPTEAEWEYACRAGSTTKYCFGDDEKSLGDYAWYNENSGDKTHPVGKKKPNAWGLHDMHGNVWELCQDWYDENYYKQSPRENPQGPSSGTHRPLRGGSWGLAHIYCRSAVRNGVAPGVIYHAAGFRVVCVVRTSQPFALLPCYPLPCFSLHFGARSGSGARMKFFFEISHFSPVAIEFAKTKSKDMGREGGIGARHFGRCVAAPGATIISIGLWRATDRAGRAAPGQRLCRVESVRYSLADSAERFGAPYR